MREGGSREPFKELLPCVREKSTDPPSGTSSVSSLWKAADGQIKKTDEVDADSGAWEICCVWVSRG